MMSSVHSPARTLVCLTRRHALLVLSRSVAAGGLIGFQDVQDATPGCGDPMKVQAFHGKKSQRQKLITLFLAKRQKKKTS